MNKIALVSSAVLLFGAMAGLAQQLPADLESGLKPFGSYQGGDIDAVTLTNGNLHVRIPIVSYPQRGDQLKLSYALEYNGKPFSVRSICVPGDSCSNQWAQPTPPPYLGAYGWGIVDEQAVKLGGYVVKKTVGGTTTNYTYETWTTSDSSVHVGQAVANGQISTDGTAFFNGQPTTGTCSAHCYTTDQSGISYFNDTNGLPAREDTNGNKITSTTDTMGRAIPTVSGSFTLTQGNSNDPTGCTGPLAIYAVTTFQAPGINNSTLNYKQCYVKVTINIPDTVATGISNGSLIRLQSLVLPNGRAWTFEYAPDSQTVSYGDLTKITFPTGGTITYGYTVEPNNNHTSRWVTSRTVNANDGQGGHLWTYTPGTLTVNGANSMKVTDPLLNDVVHTFGTFGSALYETQTQHYAGSSTSGTLLRTVQTGYFSVVATGNNAGVINVFKTSDITTLDNGLQNQVVTGYCCSVNMTETGQAISYGLPSDVKVYDFGSGAPGSLLKEKQTTYAFPSNSNFLTSNMLDRIASVDTYDGSSNHLANTTYTYDQSGYLTTSGVTTGVATPLASARGNVTSVSNWLNGGTSPVSHTNWYDTGEAYQSIDPLSHPTTYAYSSTYAGGFPTSITNAHSQTSTFAYDLNTGQKTSATDPNNQTTTYTYADSLGRLTDVLYPDVYPGSSTHGETSYVYNDSASPINFVVKEVVSPTVTLQGAVLLDGLGRKAQTAIQNGEASPSNWDMEDTCYDARGLKHFSSYTYQGSGLSSPNCTSGTGDTYAYDALARMTQVLHSDGTHVDTVYTGRASSVTGATNGSYRVQRIGQPDGLGNLSSICEVSATTQQGSSNNAPASCGLDVAGTGFLTTYTHDPLGNLKSVTQAGMGARSYVYDTLSRLTSSTNPESGTIQYVYDADSEVINRIRPKANQTSASVNTTTTYGYDNLHRLLTVGYDDGTTPAETHNYDETSARGVTLAYPTGRQTSSSVASGSTTLAAEIYSYDPVGRTVRNDQCGPSNCGSSSWPVAYTYDLMGSTLTSTNGLGTTITNSYNAGDRLSGVSSSLTGTGYLGTLLSGLHYGAFGLGSASWGNGIGETRGYDTRGRLQSRTDSLSGSTAYSYSVVHAGDGSITSANDSANGNWSYTYDDFGRLATGVGSAQSDRWDYDRYGNRWHQTVTAGSGTTYTAGFSSANNRVDGWSYDAAGNVLVDNYHHYTFDAESRIATVDTSTSYIYDADGMRVAKKVSGAVTSQYVYDLGSHAVSEMNGSGSWVRGEVYAGERHVATYQGGQTYFTHVDWLGTERRRSNVSGAACESTTSLPFGDQETISGSCNSSPQFFNGKQRDTESGLDYFKARFYNSTAGRWMLPDWSATPAAVPYADLKEPQTLNLYTYVGNDPINKEDKDGHDCCDWSAIGDYAVGILRGAVSSLSYGYAGAPKVSDSTASLAGQTFGTTAVALEGTQMTATGGGEILAGGGVTPVAALGVVTASGGAAITVGAAQNAGAIANVVAMMAPKVGESGGPGGGKDFSRGTKKQAVQENQSANEGQSKCVFCSEKVGDGTGNKINIDHAQAKSENGNNGLKNANVTCEYCNKSKGTGPAPKNPKLPN